MGPPAEAALAALRLLLGGPAGGVSVEAAGAVLRIGDDPARPLGTLVAALRGAGDRSLRWQALEILAAGGTPRSRFDAEPGLPPGTRIPREAAPVLLDLLGDEPLRTSAAIVPGSI